MQPASGDREDSFEETKTKAFQVWIKNEGRIKVEDSHPDNIKTFYSCLYRLLLFPNSTRSTKLARSFTTVRITEKSVRLSLHR